MPSTDPTERSTLRVMMTIVSPIASNAMIDAAERICWTFVALRKLGLSIVAATTTSASASRIPSSRKRNRSSARACELARASMTFCSSATVVMLVFRLQAPGWQRRRTRERRPHVLTTAPTSGASSDLLRKGAPGWQRRRTRRQSRHVLTTAPTSGASSDLLRKGAPGWQRRRTRGQSRHVLTTAPPSGASCGGVLHQSRRGVHDRVLGRVGACELLHDPALEQDDDAVGHPEHLGELRRDHQHRNTLRGE